MYEVASKRVNIVDCELILLDGASKGIQPKPYKELNKVNHASIINHLSKWTISDPKASRKDLIENLCSFLRAKGLEIENSCIPSIIVEKSYPIEVIRYSEERDYYELLGRMLWIREQWDSVIGILSGVMNPKFAEEIKNSYLDLFLDDKRVELILI
jgi:hypothetical protein